MPVTFTYSGDPSRDPLDRVRFELGDTDPLAVSGTTTAVAGSSTTITAIATSPAVNVTGSGLARGIVVIKGYIKSHATLASTFSIQHLKVTSGTSTVRIGSTLKVKLVA